MKTTKAATFVGVFVCGLISGRALLCAQPTRPPVIVEGDDKPWNRGVGLATRQTARDEFLEGNRLFNIPLYTRAAEKYLAAIERDLATFEQPHQYAEGVLYVIVNGQVVFEKGAMTPARPGRDRRSSCRAAPIRASRLAGRTSTRRSFPTSSCKSPA